MHQISLFHRRNCLILLAFALSSGLSFSPLDSHAQAAIKETTKSDTTANASLEPKISGDQLLTEIPPAEEPHVFKNDPPPLPRLPEPKGLKAMPKPHLVWIDTKKKQVVVDGYVSLDEGLLEMFACTAGTKEHESIVAVLCSAQTIHAALLAVGAKTGHPVKWDPKFEPPTGTKIEIEMRWLDAKGKWQSQDAREWIYDVKTKKMLQYHWVFAGSMFWKDEETGKEQYSAESGDLICVSNFSTAMLDIPVESSQATHGLLFEAYKKNIPKVGTPVRLVLKPKFPMTKAKASRKDAEEKKGGKGKKPARELRK